MRARARARQAGGQQVLPGNKMLSGPPPSALDGGVWATLLTIMDGQAFSETLPHLWTLHTPYPSSPPNAQATGGNRERRRKKGGDWRKGKDCEGKRAGEKTGQNKGIGKNTGYNGKTRRGLRRGGGRGMRSDDGKEVRTK